MVLLIGKRLHNTEVQCIDLVHALISNHTGSLALSKFTDRVAAKLKEEFKNAYNAKVVKIGWFPTATYTDTGIPVAQIAATNEFGGLIYHPPKQQTIYRKVNEKTGELLRNGRFVKIKQSNYATDHAAKGYWQMVPPRPFFRQMIASNCDKWPDMLSAAFKATKYDAAKTLDTVGIAVRNELKKSIVDFNDPANAPSTIRKKGFNDPLIESSHMLNTATRVVE